MDVFKVPIPGSTLDAMITDMLMGNRGKTSYNGDFEGMGTNGTETKHAVYFPIQLGNTHWSVAVVTPETEVLATMKKFRNTWGIITAVFLIVGFVYLYFTFKAWAVVREANRRLQAESALRDSHETFLTVLNSIDATIYVADMQTHEILFMNQYMKK